MAKHESVEVFENLSMTAVIPEVSREVSVPVEFCDPNWKLELSPQEINPFFDFCPVQQVTAFK